MPDNNPDTNQTPYTIHLPDASQGVENPPLLPQPNEHVPPLEVPGQEVAPEPIPEKGRHVVGPRLVKNGKKTA